jgi:hypothetical protein
MYGKPAMTCYKYQVYQYGSEEIAYLNATIHGVIRASTMIHQTGNLYD